MRRIPNRSVGGCMPRRARAAAALAAVAALGPGARGQAKPGKCDAHHREHICPIICRKSETGLGPYFLEDKCCKYQGQEANFMAPSWGAATKIWRQHVKDDFENCTGGSILFQGPEGGAGIGPSKGDWPSVVEADVTGDGGTTADGYVIKTTWFPTYVDELEDLTPRISAASTRWTDIEMQARKLQVTYNGTVRAIPFEADFAHLLVRQDLLEAANAADPALPIEPKTWDHVLQLAKHFHKKDLNGDGEPDYGLCWPVDGYAWIFQLYGVVSTYLQYEGYAQGVFFDTDTMEPLLNNTGFRKALRMFRELIFHSPVSEMGPGGGTTKAMGTPNGQWGKGRCALYIAKRGAMKKSAIKGIKDARACALNGDNVTGVWEDPTGSCACACPASAAECSCTWQPAKPWKRLKPPGSIEVYDRAAKKMKFCAPEDPVLNPTEYPAEDYIMCPNLDPATDRDGDKWVNRAPFFGTGVLGACIRKGASQARKDLLYDFIMYSNLAPQSTKYVAEDSTIDTWRTSQLENRDYFIHKAGWQEEAYDSMISIVQWGLNLRANPAMDLRVKGTNDYQTNHLLRHLVNYIFVFKSSAAAPLSDCTTGKLCECAILDPALTAGDLNSAGVCGTQARGKGLNPDVDVDRSRRADGTLPEDEFVRQVTAAWNRLSDTIADSDPRRSRRLQLNLYRDSLGLPLIVDTPVVIVQHTPATENEWLVPLVIALASVLGAIIIGGAVYWVVSTYRVKLRLERQRDKEYHQIILKAEEDAGTLGHPMVLILAETFIAMDCLTSYEQLRDEGKLVFLDTIPKIHSFRSRHFIIFLSHQWLGWGIPDPDNVHMRAMKAAVKQIAKTVWPINNDVNARSRIQTTYVWCDFISIAQDHRPMQVMAVSSLPVYSSIADAFVIVAPEAEHKGTKEICNTNTYNMRGWCRAEMLSKVCSSGLTQMYIVQGQDGHATPVTNEWMQKLDFRVFQGEFSCCTMKHKTSVRCDKETLVSPILGLYSLILRQSSQAHMGDVLAHIKRAKESFFPSDFVFETERGSEERELFGPTIRKMEQHVEQSKDSSVDAHGRFPRRWTTAEPGCASPLGTGITPDYYGMKPAPSAHKALLLDGGSPTAQQRRQIDKSAGETGNPLTPPSQAQQEAAHLIAS